MKIVIDTNVFVSALMSKNGASNSLLVRIFERSDRINVVSNSLLVEIEAVLLREQNRSRYPHLSDKEIGRFVDDIALISHHQRINFLWRPFLNDPEDDMVLETAFNASADFIVTHNLKDFRKVEERFSIRVVAPGEFLRQGAIK